MMTSLLADLESGVSTQVSDTQNTMDARERFLSGMVAVRTRLWGLSCANEGTETPGSGRDETRFELETQRHHAAASLFNLLHFYFHEDQQMVILREVSQLTSLRSGQLVEFRGDYLSNPLENELSFFGSIQPYIHDSDEVAKVLASTVRAGERRSGNPPHLLSTGSQGETLANSPEALLISALLEWGQFTPENYNVVSDDIKAWRQLWDSALEYQQKLGKAPPHQWVLNRFPDFEDTKGISPEWAASKVREASGERAAAANRLAPEAIRKDGQFALKLLGRMVADLEASPVRDLLFGIQDDLHAVVTVASEHSSATMKERLCSGQFCVVGKVTRVLHVNESIDLARRTVLGVARPELARTMLAAIHEIQASLDLRDPIVVAPAIQVLPLAIFI